MSTLAVNTITNAAGGNTATINSMTPTADSLQGFRNRIINGNMVLDQRNAGAEVNPAVSGAFYLDRWTVSSSTASKFKIGQNAGSVTPPASFTNYLGITSLSAYSVPSGELYLLTQNIEGFNVSDLGWGTASAQTVTLSFQVRSSLTGTFGGALRNSAADRSYPFTYTISAANTWETKTITIPGEATGTWVTNNGVGIRLHFGLGVGSTLSGTAGAWASANYVSATGAVSVVGTSGATFRITGVQLEAGSVATPFERRPYGTELALCQRYYEIAQFHGWARSSDNLLLGSGTYVQQKRATPTVIYSKISGAGSGTVEALVVANVYYAGAYQTGGSVSSDCRYQALASAEL
jgi:hypothetical protein